MLDPAEDWLWTISDYIYHLHTNSSILFSWHINLLTTSTVPAAALPGVLGAIVVVAVFRLEYCIHDAKDRVSCFVLLDVGCLLHANAMH